MVHTKKDQRSEINLDAGFIAALRSHCWRPSTRGRRCLQPLSRGVDKLKAPVNHPHDLQMIYHEFSAYFMDGIDDFLAYG